VCFIAVCVLLQCVFYPHLLIVGVVDCRLMRCVAVCCCVLRCVAVCCSVFQCVGHPVDDRLLQSAAVCCSVPLDNEAISRHTRAGSQIDFWTTFPKLNSPISSQESDFSSFLI